MSMMHLIDEKHEHEANAAGLRIVGSSERTGYYLYQFIKCGHVAEKSACGVRRKSVACKQCSFERHEKDARDRGLILIERSKKPGYWKYRWMSCRHVGHYTPQNLRHNKTTCQKCADLGIY